MKRLLIAATLALGALVGSEMQARANGKFGIGLNLTFSYGCSNSGSCGPNGCGTPIPYPSFQAGCPMPGYGGQPMPGYGGFDGSMAGMAPQGYGMPHYAGAPANAGAPINVSAPANPGAATGTAPAQPVATSTSGYGNYPMFTGSRGIYAIAE